MPDAARSYTFACADECLAYEFWSEAFLGRQTGPFTATVEPHCAKVIALRKPTGVPQLLGTNRHLTQGANDLGPVTWDRSQKRLSGTLTGSVGTPTAPWQYHMAFYAPAAFSLRSASVDGVPAAAASQQGEVIRLAFTLPPELQGKQVGFRLEFR
jgi:hypothetical protein